MEPVKLDWERSLDQKGNALGSALPQDSTYLPPAALEVRTAKSGEECPALLGSLVSKTKPSDSWSREGRF